MTVFVTLVAVAVADHALKWLVRRTLGPRTLSLGPLGEVRMRLAPIWLLRDGTRLGPAAAWVVWLAAAGALVVEGSALPLPGWSLGLLLGGSLSHAIETWRCGSISDYVALRGWPAFDLADVALVVGAGGTLAAFAAAAMGTLTS